MQSLTDNVSKAMDVRHLLKVLSGPNAGARVVIDSGNYRVGGTLDCDLILHDDAIIDQQLKLTIFNADILLTATPGELAINGLLLLDEQVTLHAFDVITFGESQFAIGPSSAVWPDTRVLLSGKLPPEQSITAPSSSHFKRTSLLPVVSRKVRQRSKSVARYLGLIGAGLVLAGLFAHSAVGPVEAIVDTGASERSAQRAIQIMDLSRHIKVSKDGSNRIEVTGYVMNISQEIELEERIQNLNVPTVMRIWNTEDLAQFATTVASAMGAKDVMARAVNPGDIAFSGYVDDDATWQAALGAIQRDIPAIRKIEDEDVQTRDRAAHIMRTLLVENHLSSDIAVDSDQSELVASGVLKENDMHAWTNVVNDYRARDENLPPVLDQVRAEQEVKISIPVKSVSIAGNEAYLVTKSGIRYAEGGVLSGGYKIVGIYPDRIVVQKESRKYIYTLGVKDGSK